MKGEESKIDDLGIFNEDIFNNDIYDDTCDDIVDNIVYDLNSLYEAYLKSKAGSDWKASVQMYEKDFLINIVRLRKELKDKTYKTQPGSEFTLNERGKTRQITGLQMCDRVPRHSLCDNVLMPSMLPYLIYDNGASLQGKGIDFSRHRLEMHLHEFYNKYGNDGYILIMDYSKFYDNIWHEKVYEQMSKFTDNEFALWLLQEALNNFKPDVSYMSDEEYATCMTDLFVVTTYRATIEESQKTGEKFLDKSANIGDQISQAIGISYPTPIDNFIKIVKSQKFYGRYMDDSYIISQSKEELEKLLDEIIEETRKLGIFLNKKKTHIIKLSNEFKYLQITYSVTGTGKVIRKINPQRVVDMRRKLKKLAIKVRDGERTQESVEQMFKGWMGSHARYMSRLQRDNLNLLYYDLFGGFLDEQYYIRYYPRRRNDNSRYIEWKQLHNGTDG